MTYWNTDIVTYILTQFQRTLSPLKERVQKNTKKKVEVVRIIFSMLFFNPNIWWTLKHSPSSLQVNRIASCSRVLLRRMGFSFIKIRKKIFSPMTKSLFYKRNNCTVQVLRSHVFYQKLFWRISKNSHENTCTRISFLRAGGLKTCSLFKIWDSGTCNLLPSRHLPTQK